MNHGRRDPIEQLERSHRRLEEQLEDLVLLAHEATTGDANLDALRDVAAFFARAVRRHEQDEEASFFPRLRDHAELAPLLERLAVEHAQHLALHVRLDQILEKLERAGADPTAIADLNSVAAGLRNAYRTHIEAEERTLLPAARTTLTVDQLASIGQEMQARRGRGP